MAIPTYKTDVKEQEVIVWTWVLTTADPIGTAVQLPQHADLCWQVEGTFGTATATIEGSNAGVVYGGLTNAAGGTAATFTAAGLKTIIERPLFVRPNLTTVGVGASVNVTVLARKNPQGRF